MSWSQIIFKRILWVGILFATPCFAWTQTTIQQQKNSLRQAIATSEGKEKLDNYLKLTNVYFSECLDDKKRDTLFALYDEMDAEAKRQGNIKSIGTIKGNKIAVYSNRREYEQLISRAHQDLDFFEENEQWKAFYYVYSLLCRAYDKKGEHDKALAESQNMYEHAKKRDDIEGMGAALICIAQIYGSQRRYSEGEEYYRECIELYRSNPSFQSLMPNVFYSLGQNLIAQKRYDEAIQNTREYEETLRQLEKESGKGQHSAWINLWTSYCDIYRQTGEYDKAEIYLNKVDSITGGSFKLYNIRAQIAYGKGEYEKALEIIDKDLEEDSGGMEARGMKLMILIKMGEAEDAYNLFRDVIVRMDSLRNAEFNMQLNEVRAQYEVDKHIAEKQRNRNYFLFTLGGCALLIILLGGVVYYNRIITKKNRSLYQQIREQHRRDKEAEETKAQIPPQKLTREQKLYLELQRLMQTEKLFADPDIDRDKLAERLNTNRQYLTDSIKKETGLSFSQYITDWRLKYALELLARDSNFSLEGIASESGHSSYSSFFRAFTQKYGMSPSEYRKFSENKNVELQ